MEKHTTALLVVASPVDDVSATRLRRAATILLILSILNLRGLDTVFSLVAATTILCVSSGALASKLGRIKCCAIIAALMAFSESAAVLGLVVTLHHRVPEGFAARAEAECNHMPPATFEWGANTVRHHWHHHGSFHGMMFGRGGPGYEEPGRGEAGHVFGPMADLTRDEFGHRAPDHDDAGDGGDGGDGRSRHAPGHGGRGAPNHDAHERGARPLEESPDMPHMERPSDAPLLTWGEASLDFPSDAGTASTSEEDEEGADPPNQAVFCHAAASVASHWGVGLLVLEVLIKLALGVSAAVVAKCSSKMQAAAATLPLAQPAFSSAA